MATTVSNVKEVYAICNELAREMDGQTSIKVVDTASFVDAGNTVFIPQKDNVLGAMVRFIIKRKYFDRAWKGTMGLISASESEFNTLFSKVYNYTSRVEASGAFNTDAYTNIKNGYDNGTNSGDSVGNMWEQRLPHVVEKFFIKEAAYDKGITRPLVQLQDAFNSEADFMRFWNSIMNEINNDIARYNEARNRSIVCNTIAQIYLTSPKGSKVNLVKVLNDTFGTNYTKEQIKQSHDKEFLETLIAQIKILSDRMANEYTVNYHDPMTIGEGDNTEDILRFTPKSEQKLMLFSEYLSTAKTKVMPEIFNPQYLDIKNFEAVTYWQSTNDADRMKIKVKPSLPADSSGNEVTGNNVELNDVVGILFDTERMKSTLQYEGVIDTPVEARKMYVNTWYHWKFGSISDPTENAIIFYLADEITADFTGDGTKKTFTVSDKPALIEKVTVGGTEVEVTSYVQSTGVVTLKTAPANSAAVKIYYEV